MRAQKNTELRTRTQFAAVLSMEKVVFKRICELGALGAQGVERNVYIDERAKCVLAINSDSECD